MSAHASGGDAVFDTGPTQPSLADDLVRVEGLRKTYTVRNEWGRATGELNAVDGVDLAVRSGETLAVVGESGSGKSTLGRLILQMEKPTAGRVLVRGAEASGEVARGMMQVIFQDPFSSLNPHRTALQNVLEPLAVRARERGVDAGASVDTVRDARAGATNANGVDAGAPTGAVRGTRAGAADANGADAGAVRDTRGGAADANGVAAGAARGTARSPRGGTSDARADQVATALEALAAVGIEGDAVHKRPRAFSGGQRQRIAIARAIAPRPEFIVCDEPVSALDMSIQAQVTELLQELQREFGLTYLFISHDLSVVREIADRTAVMRRGRIVELAPTAELFTDPQHAYTQRLLEAVLVPDPAVARERLAHIAARPAAELPDPGERLVETSPGHFTAR